MPTALTLFADGDRRRSRALIKAARLRDRTEIATYEAQLQARYRAAVDEADARALADVIETAGAEELRVLDRLLDAAGDSPARRAMVARLSALHSDLDTRRISRSFGE
jgi:hypothetical protein